MKPAPICAPICAAILAVSTTFAAFAGDKKPEPEPVAWGSLSNNSSCVIFAEGKKTSGRFYGIAATTKTTGKLTVIESQNYTFPQKEMLETQENLDSTLQMAQKDGVKFVKIPEKYSPELLEKARTICKASAQ